MVSYHFLDTLSMHIKKSNKPIILWMLNWGLFKKILPIFFVFFAQLVLCAPFNITHKKCS
jgi:hypothetical protein